jgi:hypothetical protein
MLPVIDLGEPITREILEKRIQRAYDPD